VISEDKQIQSCEADLNMNKSRRMVVGVCDDLHREIGKLALLNDLRTYELTNATIEKAQKKTKK